MASVITWNDSLGTASFSNGLPVPGDRFCAWVPMAPIIGAEAEALGTGEGFMFEFRADSGMSFEIREIAQDNVANALRLIRHLNRYGEVTVTTGDAVGNQYACKKWKGADPSLSAADPKTLKRTLKLTLKSLTDADCVVIWP